VFTPRKQAGTVRAALARTLHTRADVLRDETGSIAEAIAATALSIVIIGMIASGSVANLNVLAVASSNSERTQHATALVANPDFIDGWKSATSTPKQLPVTLPSGLNIDSYLWAAPASTGTTYFASIPRSGNISSWTSCASRTVVDAKNCVYASAFVSTNVRTALPTSADNLTVHNLSSPIPERTIIAKATAASVTTYWRFYVSAAAVGQNGSIDIMQGTHLLASIPVTTTPDGYFGTVAVDPGPDVTVYSPDRTIVATKVLLYKTVS
jgi:hypothetical protein